MTSKQAKSKTKKEECVSCGIETPYDDNDHVDLVDAPQELFTTGVFKIELEIFI